MLQIVTKSVVNLQFGFKNNRERRMDICSNGAKKIAEEIIKLNVKRERQLGFFSRGYIHLREEMGALGRCVSCGCEAHGQMTDCVDCHMTVCKKYCTCVRFDEEQHKHVVGCAYCFYYKSITDKNK